MRRLITIGFLRMLLPPPKPFAPDAVAEATMQRLREDARWREYDFPAYRRFVSQRPKLTPKAAAPKDLPAFLRRQA